MPHDVSRESNGLGVVITLSGVIEADEIYKIDLQLKSDELYLQQRYQIWDFSNAEELNISFDDIRDFAIQDGIAACKNPNQRIALIPRKSSHSDLDQMFHILERRESKRVENFLGRRYCKGMGQKRSEARQS